MNPGWLIFFLDQGMSTQYLTWLSYSLFTLLEENSYIWNLGMLFPASWLRSCLPMASVDQCRQYLWSIPLIYILIGTQSTSNILSILLINSRPSVDRLILHWSKIDSCQATVEQYVNRVSIVCQRYTWSSDSVIMPNSMIGTNVMWCVQMVLCFTFLHVLRAYDICVLETIAKGGCDPVSWTN